LADADKLSFVATRTLPVRHGMTIGELALMFNREKGIGADLRVVKMENWRRAHWFDQLDQTWVNPSPNMRSLTQATLYPGVGLLEYTNLSVGRGTDTPFERLGAPYIDGRALARHLNARGLAGVRFVPVRFRPVASVFKDEWCGGVNIVITDRAQFRPVRLGLELAAALRQLYPQEWKPQRVLALLVNAQAHEALLRGSEPQAVEAAAQAGLEAFRRRREGFLLTERPSARPFSPPAPPAPAGDRDTVVAPSTATVAHPRRHARAGEDEVAGHRHGAVGGVVHVEGGRLRLLAMRQAPAVVQAWRVAVCAGERRVLLARRLEVEVGREQGVGRVELGRRGRRCRRPAGLRGLRGGLGMQAQQLVSLRQALRLHVVLEVRGRHAQRPPRRAQRGAGGHARHAAHCPLRPGRAGRGAAPAPRAAARR
jgi:hypothetical protein